MSLDGHVEISLPGSPVPMFPLQEVLLFPGQILPLHIFEPRYRQMVEDSLDGPGRIVMATIRPGMVAAAGSPPAVLPVAGIGEIVRHEKLPDGRFLVWLLGLQRVRIEEVASDRLYRKVRCVPFEEVPVAAGESGDLCERLRAAAALRLPRKLQVPEQAGPGLLTDLLLQTLGAPQHFVAEIFSESNVAERARMALAAAERFPPQPRTEDGTEGEGDGTHDTDRDET
ncbi:MAG: hypothetical protein RL148_2082 [Planctomycetota bacterium]